jgi:hypothetical protein
MLFWPLWHHTTLLYLPDGGASRSLLVHCCTHVFTAYHLLLASHYFSTDFIFSITGRHHEYDKRYDFIHPYTLATIPLPMNTMMKREIMVVNGAFNNVLVATCLFSKQRRLPFQWDPWLQSYLV